TRRRGADAVGVEVVRPERVWIQRSNVRLAVAVDVSNRARAETGRGSGGRRHEIATEVGTSPIGVSPRTLVPTDRGVARPGQCDGVGIAVAVDVAKVDGLVGAAVEAPSRHDLEPGRIDVGAEAGSRGVQPEP